MSTKRRKKCAYRDASEQRIETSKYFHKKSKEETRNDTINQKLDENFFEKDCIDAAKSLLGKLIVRNIKDEKIICKIVEVESYLAKDDKASHSFNQRKTNRNEAMFMKVGTLYVYMTYGMYHCMNVSCGGPGDAVLIRGIEPVVGIEIMKKNRKQAKKSQSLSLTNKNTCNGPSKLCQALAVDKSMNKLDLTLGKDMWLEEAETVADDIIVCCKRIGIDKKKYGVWADKPLRFYVLGNEYVSLKDKIAETELHALKNKTEL